jgi:hypothetical protein
MAYFAKLENNIIIDVIVIDDNDCAGGIFPESEPVGQNFIASLNLDGNWLQTSNNFRKQYAYVGCVYDANSDAFIAPQPFSSWSLDSNHDWQAPTPKPDGNVYWDESSLSWLPVPDAG